MKTSVGIFGIGALAISVLLTMTSCSTKSVAAIDFTMSEGIVWPGEPEKPRVMYLWSLQRVMGAEGVSKLVRFVAGGGEFDMEDPRNSDLLMAPHGLFADSEDTLYVADTGGSRVCIINLQNGESRFIYEMGSEPLMAPISVVVDGRKNIYVSDADLGKVGMYSFKGKFIRHFEGPFKRPTGMAISPDNYIYIVDTWDHKIYKHTLEGRRVGSFGELGEEPGKMKYPTHLTVDSRGYLYVSDSLNFRIQIFTPTGNMVNTFGIAGDSFGTFDKIKGIAVDNQGHIYIVDSAKDMIQIYDKEGRLLLYFGKAGSFYGDFMIPTGIFIDSKNRIYVSDSFNMRVQAFQFLGGD